ncbi:MAG: [FeFe] hydrogenase H-cluster radical SAM maturase HydE [Fusobacteriota bacterium]
MEKTNRVKKLLKGKLDKKKMIELMKITDPDKLEILYTKAYEMKEKFVGKKVYYRGIIEFSNKCIKNCYYCGIRKDNKNVIRFDMKEEEILESAKWCYENKYGSLVLQSGERADEEYVDYVENLLKKIKKLSNGDLGITLSLGEQSKETYRRWYAAGAHRYLLRIETTNEELYKKIHPNDELHDFARRVKCLKDLREVGYQVGTGVMIGLPGQTEEDLVDDILQFEKWDIDMIGMGPYVIHRETPMGKEAVNSLDEQKRRFKLGLKMVALSRLYLKDINIAATTALQALNPIGRELALKAGANILMPVITHQNYREDYQLYEDKPCIDDNADDCKNCLSGRVSTVGDEIMYGKWGDSLHWKKRNDFNKT